MYKRVKIGFYIVLFNSKMVFASRVDKLLSAKISYRLSSMFSKRLLKGQWMKWLRSSNSAQLAQLPDCRRPNCCNRVFTRQ